MTESEWLTGNEIFPMRELLETKGSDRKKRLYACACVRQFWDRIELAECKNAVEIVEKYVDGRVFTEHVERIRKTAEAAAWPNRAEQIANDTSGHGVSPPLTIDYVASNVPRTCPPKKDMFFVTWIASMIIEVSRNYRKPTNSMIPEITAYQCNLLRDLLGNPFNPVSLDECWLTPTVKSLADVIYRENIHQDLPILADALEEAGCDNDTLLSHCRKHTFHVKGCWVVDLLLNRS